MSILLLYLFSLNAFSFDISHEVSKLHLQSGDLSLYAVSKKEVLIDLNSKKLMTPASVTKLITASAVLHALGPSTKLTTELLSSAQIEETILKGDIYLHGGGDPSFVSESMWFLVNELTRTQITKIEGDIVVDDTLFDAVRFDSGREKVRNDRAYDAPIGAMSMNWNAVNVFVRPAKKVGEPALVFADPETSYIQIKNESKTVSGNKADVFVSRKGKILEDEDSVGFGDAIVISGKIGIEANEKVIFKNISQPDLWSGANLQAFLKARGISITGRVRAGKTPPGAKTLARFESKPLTQMISDMLKFSNNFVAEMLTKQLALKKGIVPATLVSGLEDIRIYLHFLGFKDDAIKIENPSGFSRQNKISALSLTNVLLKVQNDFKIFPELFAALPISGRDGTLKNRMKGLAEKVRAKTGYMTGIAALAGFVDRGENEGVTFAFLFNGPADKADEAKTLMDRLCEKLASK